MSSKGQETDRNWPKPLLYTVSLEDVTLGEISQTQEHRSCVIVTDLSFTSSPPGDCSQPEGKVTICGSRQTRYPLTKEWRRGSSRSGSAFSPRVDKDHLFREGAEGAVRGLGRCH